ncbi:MAG TPA: hypothetical protein VKD90_09135 [Gemmataceae bacterium]|nr:hypothetical protein [Gemmataceae bacterium]
MDPKADYADGPRPSERAVAILGIVLPILGTAAIGGAVALVVYFVGSK